MQIRLYTVVGIAGEAKVQKEELAIRRRGLISLLEVLVRV